MTGFFDFPSEDCKENFWLKEDDEEGEHEAIAESLQQATMQVITWPGSFGIMFFGVWLTDYAH